MAPISSASRRIGPRIRLRYGPPKRPGFGIGFGVLATFSLLAAVCGGGGPAQPKLVVDSNADRVERDGVLTLREAIVLATGGLSRSDLDPQEAKQVRGKPGPASADLILFARPFEADQAIALGSSLPPLASGNDSIDGSGVGRVAIRGDVHKSFVCIEITSSDNVLRGLEITNCLRGILVADEAQGNRIGGSGGGRGNVISANVVGIELRGRKNVIQGNLIGLDARGTEAVGNEHEGIWIAAARENIIGGPGPGEGNVISGNKLFGVNIDGAANNVLQGNLIGLDPSGSRPLGNRHGISVQAGARGNIIGGEKVEERNVISANETGIVLRDSLTTGNVVRGNYLGTDVDGEIEVANGADIWEMEGVGENVLEGNRVSE